MKMRQPENVETGSSQSYLLTDVLVQFELLFQRLHLVLRFDSPQHLRAQLVLGFCQQSLQLVTQIRRTSELKD